MRPSRVADLLCEDLRAGSKMISFDYYIQIFSGRDHGLQMAGRSSDESARSRSRSPGCDSPAVCAYSSSSRILLDYLTAGGWPVVLVALAALAFHVAYRRPRTIRATNASRDAT